MSAGGDEINGTVYHPPFPSKMQNAGTFSIRKVSASHQPQPPQCKRHGPAPGPSPAPPGPAPKPDGPNPAKLWPAPAHYYPASGGSAAIIDASTLTLSCLSPDQAEVCAQLVAPAFDRGKQWAFSVPTADPSGATLSSLVVNVGGAVALQLDVNESYTLKVNGTTAVITAETAWGAMHGLESFFQLVLIEPGVTCPDCNKYKLQVDVPFTIVDRPRTRWRGLMIDTGALRLPIVTCEVCRASFALSASCPYRAALSTAGHDQEGDRGDGCLQDERAPLAPHR